MLQTVHVLMPQFAACYSDALAACAEMRALRQEINATADLAHRASLQERYFDAGVRWRDAYEEFFATFRRMAQRARPRNGGARAPQEQKKRGRKNLPHKAHS